jgi:hypothetical protein
MGGTAFSDFHHGLLRLSGRSFYLDIISTRGVNSMPPRYLPPETNCEGASKDSDYAMLIHHSAVVFSFPGSSNQVEWSNCERKKFARSSSALGKALLGVAMTR